METMGSNNCRKSSEDNKGANNVLAIIQEKVRFFYRNR